MNCIEETLELDGFCLQRYVFQPDAGVPVRGTAFHFHGQGDFSKRYGEILRPFLQKGIACVATDLPGHCLLYTSPSPRDRQKSRMPSSA